MPDDNVVWEPPKKRFFVQEWYEPDLFDYILGRREGWRTFGEYETKERAIARAEKVYERDEAVGRTARIRVVEAP